MTYCQFESALSSSRLDRYKLACSNDTRKTLKLYRGNIKLSQKLYAVIGIFEVVLRNCIDRHFTKIKGPQWLADAVDESTGYLNNTGCENSFHSVQEGIYKLGIKYTHEGLLSSLTFGFWTYQFNKNEFAASGNTLLQIFANRPHGTKQKDIFQSLMKINILRNRIAHHEPICFDNVTGIISTADAIKRYTLICDLVTWLGYDSKKLFFGIDDVTKGIAFINNL